MAVKERFDAVQILRALAASLVVFQHALMNWAEKATAPGTIPFFPHLGDYGVKLFFCISGFIIVHTSESQPQGWEPAKKFWARRIRRIVPLYWIVTTVYVLKLAITANCPSIGELLQSYLFIPYVNPTGLIQPILGQGWSLNYEMLFYLSFGATFFLTRAWRVPAIVTLMASLAAARTLGLLGHSPLNPIFHWADSVILYFVAGVTACVAAREWRARCLPALSQSSAAIISAIIVVGYAAFALPTNESQWATWMPVASVAPLLLCITARPGEIGALWHPAIAAGDASYSTYLVHGFLMGPLARLLGGLSVTGVLGYYAFAWVCVLACTAFGFLVYVLLEKPLYSGVRSRLRLSFSAFMPRRKLP